MICRGRFSFVLVSRFLLGMLGRLLGYLFCVRSNADIGHKFGLCGLVLVECSSFAEPCPPCGECFEVGHAVYDPVAVGALVVGIPSEHEVIERIHVWAMAEVASQKVKAFRGV